MFEAETVFDDLLVLKFIKKFSTELLIKKSAKEIQQA